jgi:hypothetical protein
LCVYSMKQQQLNRRNGQTGLNLQQRSQCRNV